MEGEELISRLYQETLDYSKLPYNSAAAAAQRIRESYYDNGTINAEDLRIVIGDPSKGVCIGNIESFMKESTRFLE